MSRWVKWVAIPVGALGAVIGAGVGYLFAGFPKVSAASEVKVQATPELVSRGAYLANHVSVCIDCHAERDWSLFSAPPKPGSEGSGGDEFPRELGFPGNFYSKNLTPAALGEWSDGEIARAITTGVSRDGESLFPLMPYPNYRHLCEEDVSAIVAYLRTLKSVQKDIPERELDFPVNLIVRTIPADADPWACPTPGTAGYGEYLTNAAGCAECHTNQDQGQKIGEPFAGGWRMPLPTGGHVVTANITPDEETGIGRWSKDQFVAAFKRHEDRSKLAKIAPGTFNTIMPWNMYAGMSETDLGAIYDHLRTVPAVKNRVERFEPPQ